MRNMLVKSVAAALALAAAASANAAIDTPYAGANGELFLTVWDPTVGNEASFNLGLNINVNNFDASVTHTYTNIFNDSVFQQYFGAGSVGGSNLANQSVWQYNVTGARTLSDESSILFTQVGTVSLINGAVDNAATGVLAYQNALGSVCDSCGTDIKASPKYAGDNYGSNFNGLAPVSDAAGIGTALNFFRAFNNTAESGYENSSDSPATMTQLAGTWLLSSANNGTLTYSVAPVPLPAAAWLLGSGLIGLFGIGRRRSV